MDQARQGHHTSTKHTAQQHPAHAQQSSVNAGVVVLWIILGTVLAVVLWRFSTRKARRAAAKQRAAALAAQEEQRRRDAAAQAETERRRAEQAEYYRQLGIWQAAERAADAPCHTSLLLHPDEIVGYATTVDRIVTHKVGHKSDRVSSRTGITSGQTQHQGTTESTNAGFGMWGMRDGTSRGASSGVARHVSQQTSAGEGHTYSKDDIRTEIVDRGQLVLTNQRVVFQGDNASLEIPMGKVIGFHFSADSRLVIDYAKRLTGECYVVPDALAMKIAMSKRLREPGFEVTKPPVLQAGPPSGSPEHGHED